MIGDEYSDSTFEIVGEKLNGFIPATGKAIQDRDANYIRALAKAQVQAGADYLDICPATNEGALDAMRWMVDLVQDACDVSISLDSPDAEVLFKAMEFVDKPGLVNSSSLAGNKNDLLFPAVANTDWKVVVMLDDDDGIDPTAEGRIDIFRRNMDKAAQYGVSPGQLYFDPQVETLATNGEGARIFMEVARAIKAETPDCHVISGLSNISYGLPSRKHINMPFVTLCMQAGMDAAIIDPLNRDLMGTIYGTYALLGYDDFCMEYIGAFREGLFGPVD